MLRVHMRGSISYLRGSLSEAAGSDGCQHACDDMRSMNDNPGVSLLDYPQAHLRCDAKYESTCERCKSQGRRPSLTIHGGLFCGLNSECSGYVCGDK